MHEAELVAMWTAPLQLHFHFIAYPQIAPLVVQAFPNDYMTEFVGLVSHYFVTQDHERKLDLLSHTLTQSGDFTAPSKRHTIFSSPKSVSVDVFEAAHATTNMPKRDISLKEAVDSNFDNPDEYWFSLDAPSAAEDFRKLQLPWHLPLGLLLTIMSAAPLSSTINYHLTVHTTPSQRLYVSPLNPSSCKNISDYFLNGLKESILLLNGPVAALKLWNAQNKEACQALWHNYKNRNWGDYLKDVSLLTRAFDCDSCDGGGGAAVPLRIIYRRPQTVAMDFRDPVNSLWVFLQPKILFSENVSLDSILQGQNISIRDYAVFTIYGEKLGLSSKLLDVYYRCHSPDLLLYLLLLP